MYLLRGAPLHAFLPDFLSHSRPLYGTETRILNIRQWRTAHSNSYSICDGREEQSFAIGTLNVELQ